MATSQLSSSLCLLNLSHSHHRRPSESRPVSNRTRLAPRRSFVVRADNDMLGDFGARDPFPAEVESRFGEKVLGNMNTEHKILIPNLAALSLATLQLQPLSPLQTPMSEDDAKKLLRKVLGWRLINEEGVLKLQCVWKLRDSQCCVDLVDMINKVVEFTGHLPQLQVEEPNQVKATLWTSSIGGLSMNDFIVAAKIDEIKTSDLVARKRAWA